MLNGHFRCPLWTDVNGMEQVLGQGNPAWRAPELKYQAELVYRWEQRSFLIWFHQERSEGVGRYL